MAGGAAAVLVVAGASGAIADDIYNNLDNTIDAIAEIMPLNVGGPDGSTILAVRATKDAGESNPCNFGPPGNPNGTTPTVSVSSSNPAVATASESSLTFASCNDARTLTVKPLTVGSATITLKTVTNTTGGTFNLAPATFQVNVAGPTNTAPRVEVTGVGDGNTSFEYDMVPAALCAVTDNEDGNTSFAAAVEPIDATNGIGTFKASCEYTDKGGLIASSSVSYTVTKIPTSLALSCPRDPVTYTGGALEPCSALVGGRDLPEDAVATFTYSKNTNVGLATVTASYAGDIHHEASTADGGFTIAKATPELELNCPDKARWTGSAIQPCWAKVSGAEPGAEADLKYGSNTAVGTASVTATYIGDDNHNTVEKSVNFEIIKAESVLSISCPDTVTYNGDAHTPCKATLTGAGGLSKSVTVTYEGNINAGTATATADWEGDDNHEEASDSKTFEITRAESTVTVHCTEGSVYTGYTVTPCTAVAQGVGMDVTLVVTYSNNTNAGTATASANWDGDGNHFGSEDSVDFQIAKATSSIEFTCETDLVYTGEALEPCTAVATGVGMSNVPLTVTHGNVVDAGDWKATASWEGDNNHHGNSGSATFKIAKADSTVTVSCPGEHTYTGQPIKPCTATATGAGELNKPLEEITYNNNINATTETSKALAEASWTGDNNHDGNAGSATFEIAKADSTVSLSCTPSVWFTGKAIEPCTATVTGAGGLNKSVAVEYTDNVQAGEKTATAYYAGDANHEKSETETAYFTIKGFKLDGFYKPVDMGLLNTVKAGSTVPLKFEVFLNGVERTDTAAVVGFSAKAISCGTKADLGEAPVEVLTTGGTALRYDTTGGQFIQNWQTSKQNPGSCYTVTMKTIDGGTITADFKLK
jgi:hypothetical protein